MSFSFYVKAPVRPRYGDIVEDLPFPEVCCCEERDALEARRSDRDEDEEEAEFTDEDEDEGEGFDLDEPWPERPLHFYLPSVSIRAIEAVWEDGTFQVRIMAFSGREEYDLAFALLERAAELFESDVEPEDGEPVAVERLREAYGPTWVEGQMSLFQVLPQMARQQGNTLQMMGPVRPFHLGPRLLGELEGAGPPEELPERIIELMRRVQYVDPEEYYCAGALRLEKRGGGKAITLAAWGPNVRYLFPDVQYLAVIEGEQGHFMVPYRALPEIAGDRCTFLDEVQTLVEPFDDYEWADLVERARPHAVDPIGAPEPEE
jgi:hypothetical protein